MIPTNTPTGTQVRVTLDDGTKMDTVTKSDPWQLGHGAWVIKVAGISGGYSIDRMELLTPGPPVSNEQHIAESLRLLANDLRTKKITRQMIVALAAKLDGLAVLIEQKGKE